jgi:hypothetical protein
MAKKEAEEEKKTKITFAENVPHKAFAEELSCQKKLSQTMQKQF